MKRRNKQNIPFLGRIPFDLKLVECADRGESYLGKYPDSEITKAYDQIIANILKTTK